MTHYENIPNELKKLNQWVCTRGDSKVPMKTFLRMKAASSHQTLHMGYLRYSRGSCVEGGSMTTAALSLLITVMLALTSTPGMTRTASYLLLRQQSSASAKVTQRGRKAAEGFTFSSEVRSRLRGKTTLPEWRFTRRLGISS